MTQLSRSEMGVLYPGRCACCGHCVDSHIEGESPAVANYRIPGFKRSLDGCHGYKIRKVDMKGVVYAEARRRFFELESPFIISEYPGVAEAAEQVLAENREKWEKENPFLGGWYPPIDASVVLITTDGRVYDMGS